MENEIEKSFAFIFHFASSPKIVTMSNYIHQSITTRDLLKRQWQWS